jgi:hypothetical protein
MTAGPWDAGASNERTGLAWRRSALSVLTAAALMLHAALDGRVRPPQLAAAVLLGLAAGWTDRQGQRAYRARAGGEEECRPSSPRVLAGLTAVTLLAAATALAQLAGQL